MGRTIYGNLTGAAARVQWQDFQEQIQIGKEKAAAKRQAQLMDMTQEIRDTMTQEEYNAWWEAAPEQGFYSYTEDYLLALKGKTNHYNNVINGTAKMTPAYRAQLHAEYNARFTH